MEKLKVGLIVDSTELPNYLHELLQLAEFSKKYCITHLIVYDFSLRKSKRSKFQKLLNNPRLISRYIDVFFFRITAIIELFLFRKHFLRKYDTCRAIDNVSNLKLLKISPIVSSSGFVYTFSTSDLELLEKQKLDLMIRCGSGILQGEILNAAKYGILSFHHGNNDIYRGGPAGFWEVYHGEKETGFIIQQLTNKLDGGRVLFKGAYQTQWYFKLNQANVISLSVIHLHNLLEKIASKGWDSIPIKDSVPYYNPLFTIPRFWQTFYYTGKLFSKISKKVINRILGLRITWGIAYGKGAIFQADLRKSKILRYSKRKGFIADPFIIKHNEKNYIFCEELLYKENKGVISLFEIGNKTKAKYLGRVLEESFHLSFPFVFELNGKYYMLPESLNVNQIRLYESDDFPFKWKLSCVLIDNVSAADPILFRQGNYWWLFFSVDSSGTNYQNSELHAYYSEDLFNGTWNPHESNPIVFTPDGGRNGGAIISSGDSKYRVGQTHAIDIYGESILVSKINNLSTNFYEEIPAFKIRPHFFNAITGTHHLSQNDEFYVVDFQQRIYFSYR